MVPLSKHEKWCIEAVPNKKCGSEFLAGRQTCGHIEIVHMPVSGGTQLVVCPQIRSQILASTPQPQHRLSPSSILSLNSGCEHSIKSLHQYKDHHPCLAHEPTVQVFSMQAVRPSSELTTW